MAGGEATDGPGDVVGGEATGGAGAAVGGGSAGAGIAVESTGGADAGGLASGTELGGGAVVVVGSAAVVDGSTPAAAPGSVAVVVGSTTGAVPCPSAVAPSSEGRTRLAGCTSGAADANVAAATMPDTGATTAMRRAREWGARSRVVLSPDATPTGADGAGRAKARHRRAHRWTKIWTTKLMPPLSTTPTPAWLKAGLSMFLM